MSQTATTTRTRHLLIGAAQGLVSDLLSTLAFAALYAATHSVRVSVGVAIAMGLGQIAWQRWHGATIDAMQWLSLFLVVALGGAALLTGNPTFVMLKPTLAYWSVGAVMLRPGWMNRYAPPIAHEYGADILTAFGYVWAGLMFATAAANLAVALWAGHAAWAWFIGSFPIASKAALIGVQYVTMRRVIRRRIRAVRLVGVPA